jgi:hypothetical protein
MLEGFSKIADHFEKPANLIDIGTPAPAQHFDITDNKYGSAQGIMYGMSKLGLTGRFKKSSLV